MRCRSHDGRNGRSRRVLFDLRLRKRTIDLEFEYESPPAGSPEVEVDPPSLVGSFPEHAPPKARGDPLLIDAVHVTRKGSLKGLDSLSGQAREESRCEMMGDSGLPRERSQDLRKLNFFGRIAKRPHYRRRRKAWR
jgi:hypothetical protein